MQAGQNCTLSSEKLSNRHSAGRLPARTRCAHLPMIYQRSEKQAEENLHRASLVPRTREAVIKIDIRALVANTIVEGAAQECANIARVELYRKEREHAHHLVVHAPRANYQRCCHQDQRSMRPQPSLPVPDTKVYSGGDRR